MLSGLTAFDSVRNASTMAWGSDWSSVVTVISTRLQVERITASDLIEIRPDAVRAHGLRLRQERIHDGLGVRLVVGGHRDLHTVASGEDHSFRDALPGLQVRQSRRQRFFPEREAFAHFDGCGFVTRSAEHTSELQS